MKTPREDIGTTRCSMEDGLPLRIRQIQPEDEPLMVRFHQGLSESSVHQRYFQNLKLSRRILHERLANVCDSHNALDVVLVAEATNTAGSTEIIGVGRLSVDSAGREGELALLVSDSNQKRGLGTELSRQLLGIAQNEGLRRISAYILRDNLGMKKICQKLGMHFSDDLLDETVHATLELK